MFFMKKSIVFLFYTYTHSFFYIISHYGLSQDIEYSSLWYTIGPCCLSILNVVVCIYQPQTPSPFLCLPTLPYQPQICFLCLWICFYLFSSVQSLTHFQLFVTPWTAACQASLSITNWRNLPKPIHWVGDAIQPSHPLPSPSPPALNLSQHQGFSNESALHIRWPKYWSFSFNISPSNEHPGLISFGMDWLDLLAVQGTLENLLQYHSSKASILQCLTFLMVQLSHPYMTPGKTIVLTRRMAK